MIILTSSTGRSRISIWPDW